MVKLFPVLHPDDCTRFYRCVDLTGQGYYEDPLPMLVIFFSGCCFISILNYFGIGINSNKKEKSQTVDCLCKKCIICFSEDREMVFKPCKHLCVCQNCCARIIQDSNKCPFCQNLIIHSERIYLP